MKSLALTRPSNGQLVESQVFVSNPGANKDIKSSLKGGTSLIRYRYRYFPTFFLITIERIKGGNSVENIQEKWS